MALQFIMGGSGSGKSTYLFRHILKEAAIYPHINYLILVPDQFTLETQRTLVELSSGKGILNIDVLSFHRFAYRAFEEMPAKRRTVLEDMGKMMLLRKVFLEQKKKLRYFRHGLHGIGFLDECKSFLCELAQYAISEEDLEEMIKIFGAESLMGMKLADLKLIYQAFLEKMGDTYMMAEELVPQLTGMVSSMSKVRDSVVCLDGFTGFTPTQYDLLTELLGLCQQMFVTVTTDRTEKRGQVFSISSDTIRRLTSLAGERGVSVEPPIMTGKGKDKIPYRVAGNKELAFLERSLFAYGIVPWEEKPENIEITLCKRAADEASYVARRIFWLVREEGYQYEEIAVVTAGMTTYEQALSQEFDKMGIRYFMDTTRSIGANAMAEYVMAFANMVEKGMDYESTFRFLRCGLSPLMMEETDLLENYVIAQGRRGLAAYQREWEYEVEQLDLVQINEYRRKFLASIEDAVLSLKGGKKTVREFTGILYDLVLKNQIYERLQEKSAAFEEAGKPILAGEYKSIYRLMMDLWDEMVELLGDETVTFHEYNELLSAGISEGLLGFIPPTSHQVVVGDVRRSRLKNIRVLFFVGVNDAYIPKEKGAAGILSQSERRKIKEAGIELSPDAERESYTEQFYLYLALTKASEKVILTYAAMGNDGSSKRPAYLIKRVQNLFPAMRIKREEDEQSISKILGSDCGKTYLIRHLADGSYKNDSAWRQLAVFYEKKQPGLLESWMEIRSRSKAKLPLRKEAARRLYGSILEGSVTRIEQFVKCPFAHFIRYGLRLRERQQYEISSLDRGNVFHQAMEHFSHELEREDREWQDLTEEEAVSLAAECVDYAVERYQGQKYFQSGRTLFMTKRLKNEIKHSVWALWHQMQEGDFHQHYTEKHFSGRGEQGVFALRVPLKDGAEISLNGVIDRVDVCSVPEGKLIKIVDYKSGDYVELSLAEVYHGLQMQLPTYMAAAKELIQREQGGEVIPAAMLYYAMKEKNLDWKEEDEESRRRRALEQMKCKGYVNANPVVVKCLDHGMVNGGELVPASASALFPIEADKVGNYTKKSQVMSTEQFELLMRHTRKKMAESGEQILAGEIGASPSCFEGKDACEYCQFGSVCGQEKEVLKDTVRVMENLSDEEVWEVLDEQD